MLSRFALFTVMLYTPLVMAAQEGIFADFTTSLGSFTCQLDYTNAPKAAANFIGLATGQRAWLDATSGVCRTNHYYDGLQFHRVISNFMIQSGSANGLGTDNPGYSFTDEFSGTTFSGPGVLASANSGPDSNGAQFFVTVTDTPWLNGVHTIFGHVTSGQEVVNAIDSVATDANNMPLTNVILQSVQIRRVGTQAEAFDINGVGLPVVANLPLSISLVDPNVHLAFLNKLHSETRVFISGDFAGWDWGTMGVETLGAQSQWQDYLAWDTTAPAQFFRFAQAQYPSTRPAPKSVVGHTISFAFDSLGTNTTTFGMNGTGSYIWPAQSVSTPQPIGYYWKQDPYRGRFLPLAWAYFGSWKLHLSFSTATNGTFLASDPNGFSYPGVFKMN